MRIAMTLLALSLTMSVAACKKKKPAGDTMASGSTMAGTGSSMAGTGSSMAGSDMAGSGSSMAGSGSDTMAGSGSNAMAGSGSGAGEEKMAHSAGNCPSTVLGSTTTAVVKGKDVVLTITSKDKDAIATIQRRAETLVKEKADGGSGAGAHDQKGSHGGESGVCPVYWGEGGKAAYKKDAKGAVVTITPKEKPDDLKKTIDERIAKAAEWVKANVKEGDKGNEGGVGGGKGDHGGNHSGSGDSKGQERKGGTGGGAGTGGGGGAGSGSGAGGAKKTGK